MKRMNRSQVSSLHNELISKGYERTYHLDKVGNYQFIGFSKPEHWQHPLPQNKDVVCIHWISTSVAQVSVHGNKSCPHYGKNTIMCDNPECGKKAVFICEHCKKAVCKDCADLDREDMHSLTPGKNREYVFVKSDVWLTICRECYLTIKGLLNPRPAGILAVPKWDKNF